MNRRAFMSKVSLSIIGACNMSAVATVAAEPHPAKPRVGEVWMYPENKCIHTRYLVARVEPLSDDVYVNPIVHVPGYTEGIVHVFDSPWKRVQKSEWSKMIRVADLYAGSRTELNRRKEKSNAANTKG